MTHSTSKHWGIDLADVVASYHTRGGQPSIADRDRDKVIALLEEALLDQETKETLHNDIKRLCGGKFPHFEARDEAWLEQVLTGGLTVLENQELAILLLDPDIFCWVEDEINDAVEEYPIWWEQLDRIGRRLMARHGKTIPEIQLNGWDGTVTPSSLSPALAGMLGHGADETEPEGRQLRIEVPPASCEWIAGNPQSIHEMAVVEFEIFETGAFNVGVAGFLKPGLDVSLKIIWQSSSGEVLAEVSPSSPMWLKVTLQSGTRQLIAGDRVRIQYKNDDSALAVMEVHIELEVPHTQETTVEISKPQSRFPSSIENRSMFDVALSGESERSIPASTSDFREKAFTLTPDQLRWSGAEKEVQKRRTSKAWAILAEDSDNTVVLELGGTLALSEDSKVVVKKTDKQAIRCARDDNEPSIVTLYIAWREVKRLVVFLQFAGADGDYSVEFDLDWE